MQRDAHAGGLIAATLIAALATVGTHLTTLRGVGAFDTLWIALFAAAWLLMSAAAVGFDMKRWLW